MTVLDVLKTSSLYLNISNMLAPIFNEEQNVSEEATNELNKLLLCFNNTISQIASTYFEVLSSSVIEVQNGEYDLSGLTHKCLDVKSLTSGGRKVKFTVENGILRTVRNGSFTITYSYVPEELDEDDDIEIFDIIDLDTLAMGVAADYCYMNAIYDDGQMWHGRFVDNLRLIKANHIKNAYILPRRWL